MKEIRGKISGDVKGGILYVERAMTKGFVEVFCGSGGGLCKPVQCLGAGEDAGNRNIIVIDCPYTGTEPLRVTLVRE